MHLLKHLAVHFPGLALATPLFHNWPTALRFELSLTSGRLDKRDEYDEGAVQRAKTLYESAFAPADVCYLVSKQYHDHGEGRMQRRILNIFDLARKSNHGIGRPSGRYKCAHDKDMSITFRWAEVSARNIDYDWILAKIARSDFPIGSGFPDDIFFVNITRNLIFHMYDDRGLDLIAAKRTTLQPIYESHKDWLLSYDLARMQQNFEHTPPHAIESNQRRPS